MDRSDDAIVAMDGHWKALGHDTGWRLRAARSITVVDDVIRERDEAALAPHRLTRARHEALAILYFSRAGELPLGKLGQRLLVHPTSVTSTVDALERTGLVERVAHPTDRRTTLARITAAGRRAMRGSCERIAADRSGIGVLTDGDAQRLFDILRRVRADAGDLKRAAGRAEPTDDPILVGERNWAREGWVSGPWYRASVSVYRVAELVRESDEATLRPLRLTRTRHDALSALCFSEDGALPMGKLGEQLGVHATSITSTVDALQDLGYVRRVPHPTDRRTTLAQVTPKGRRTVDAAARGITAAECGLGSLSNTQARVVFTMLAPVRATGATG